MKDIVDCCKIKNVNSQSKQCKRLSDSKVFTLPRKYSKIQCLSKPITGFTMRSSCAPFKDCKKITNKKFLFNPQNPKKSFDVYIDKNPNDTIPIKYKTVDDVKSTIKKLENLYKKSMYSHKRIWQVAMIMKVRLSAIVKHKNKYPRAKDLEQRHSIATKYMRFLSERTKVKTESNRKKMVFK